MSNQANSSEDRWLWFIGGGTIGALFVWFVFVPPLPKPQAKEQPSPDFVEERLIDAKTQTDVLVIRATSAEQLEAQIEQRSPIWQVQGQFVSADQKNPHPHMTILVGPPLH